jgi:hypothetical protein
MQMKNRCTKELRNFLKDVKLRGCVVCRYRYEIAALQFHHMEEKSFHLSTLPKGITPLELLDELEKCCLVCSNCHAELHAGSCPVKPGRLELSEEEYQFLYRLEETLTE